jgi:GTP cyclohydrolase IB
MLGEILYLGDGWKGCRSCFALGQDCWQGWFLSLTLMAIPDVQGSADTRNIAIDQVGIKNVTFPIRLAVPTSHKDGWQAGEQTTVATISMYVALPAHQKGTHMSRFVQVLNEESAQGKPAITPERIPLITHQIAERLNAQSAHFHASFTYFIRKKAPVSGAPGLMDYKVSFSCDAGPGLAKPDLIMSVRAPATSLCPCSKEISKYGAHNQRCEIEAQIRTKPDTFLWIEELVTILENAASCPVYSVLKRPDEKLVTEAAFDNPKFVEDIIRDLALGLDKEPRVTWYAIDSENFESIHNHNAYARIVRDKR